MGLLTRTRQPVIDGYTQRQFKSIESFNLDGVVIAKRRRARGFKLELPIRQFLYLFLAIFSFKIFLFCNSQAPPTFECYCQFYGESNLPFCACFFLSCLNSVAPG